MTGNSTQRYTREDVVHTAMAMLGRGGLPAFSMRALARELDVQPSALYWHFDDKQTLLAAIADAIIAAMPAAAGESPQQAATQLRATLLAWQDGAEIVTSSLALGLCGDAVLLRLARAFENAGLPRAAADTAALVLLRYVLGHVALEQQRDQAERAGVTVYAHPVHASNGTFSDGLTALLRGLAPS